MIEVNLLPGATRRPTRRASFNFAAFSKFRAGIKLNRMTMAIVLAWIAGPGLVVWLFLGTAQRRDALTGQVETAVQDSLRYARIIAANEGLKARRDTIAQKVQLIQEIDAGRYVWAHVLDEVSRVLPHYTWLTTVEQTSGGMLPMLTIGGRTGNTFALTEFMKDLEASPFLKNVKLTETELIEETGTRVHRFALEAEYEEPAAGIIQTVPLFAVDTDKQEQ